MVGAGVAGLVAARRLVLTGAAVVVLEAADRPGGQVDTLEVEPGVFLDVGAEALALTAPGVATLVDELGLTDSVVRSPGVASTIATSRGLRDLPAGVGPAGPTRLWPVVRSRTLPWPALARAALEPLAARRMPTLAPDADVAVGDFVRGRFGAPVSRTYVGTLLGTIHAGDVGRLSLRATSPSLVPAATEGRSLVLRKRPSGPGATMELVTWPEGLSTLVRRLTSGLQVRSGTPVTGLTRSGDGYDVVTVHGRVGADAVVLAVPASPAAALLHDLAPTAADLLAGAETADVVTVLVGLPRAQVSSALRGTGLLVPPDSGRLLKAATYLSRKWPHLAGHDTFWLRLSAGRAGDPRAMQLDDAELVSALLVDLEELTGLVAEPRHVVVRRWPAALPQLTVGHLARMAAVRADLPDGIALAGASYDGVGLAAGLRSGEGAATALIREEP